MFGLKEAKDWTHNVVEITDIRKLSEFYIFTIEGLDSPLMVKDKIFEERLKNYFLKDAYKVSREEILNVKWNMYVSRGYYIKISRGEVQKYELDPDKSYVSYLEISGTLASFSSICNKDKEY